MPLSPQVVAQPSPASVRKVRKIKKKQSKQSSPPTKKNPLDVEATTPDLGASVTKKKRKLKGDGKQKDKTTCQPDAAAVPVVTETQKGKQKRKPSTDQSVDSMHSKRQRVEDEVCAERLTPSSIAFRKKHEIVVTGTCPAPFESFDDAETGLGAPLTDALKKQGFTEPTPIQAQAWSVALRGQDMVAVSKTGSGKTCGFLLPVLARFSKRKQNKTSDLATPSALVLAPTRELAQQIAKEAEKFAAVANARVVTLYGGVSKREQIDQLKAGADIVIATPGRLLDFARGNPERGIPPLVTMQAVTYLVLDEGDRMLDMGFEPDIREIVKACPASGRPSQGGGAGGEQAGTARQTLFFTATWPKEVQESANALTKHAVHVKIGQSKGGDKLTANASVRQKVYVVEEREKLSRLRELLTSELDAGDTAFVFAKTRRTCDFLEEKLWDKQEDLSTGMWCRTIHSHKEQWVRDEALETFRSLTAGNGNGRKGILIATDVAARGLDIPGVAMVINYDFGGGGLGMDSDVESYVHRIGRTGRAGKTGKAYTFFTEHDKGAAPFVEVLAKAKQRVPYELQALADKDARRRNPGQKGGKNNDKFVFGNPKGFAKRK